MAVGPYVVYAELGVLTTVAVVVGCFTAPFMGGLVDRQGRRRLSMVLLATGAAGFGHGRRGPPGRLRG